MPKRKRFKASRRAVPNPSPPEDLTRLIGDAAPVTAPAEHSNAPPTAAQQVLASSELRRRIFERLDKADLARCMRTKKVWMYDVAQVLYEDIDYTVVENMKRSSARRRIYCDAVRTIRQLYLFCVGPLCVDTRMTRTSRRAAGVAGRLDDTAQAVFLAAKVIVRICPYVTTLVYDYSGTMFTIDAWGTVTHLAGPTRYFVPDNEQESLISYSLSGIRGVPRSTSELHVELTEPIHLSAQSLQFLAGYARICNVDVSSRDSLAAGHGLSLLQSLKELHPRGFPHITEYSGPLDTCTLAHLRTLAPLLAGCSIVDLQLQVPDGIVSWPSDIATIADFPEIIRLFSSTLPALRRLAMALQWTLGVGTAARSWDVDVRQAMQLERLKLTISGLPGSSEPGIMNICYHLAKVIALPRHDSLTVFSADSPWWVPAPHWQAWTFAMHRLFSSTSFPLDLRKWDMDGLGVREDLDIENLVLSEDGTPIPVLKTLISRASSSIASSKICGAQKLFNALSVIGLTDCGAPEKRAAHRALRTVLYESDATYEAAGYWAHRFRKRFNDARELQDLCEYLHRTVWKWILAERDLAKA